MSPDIGSAPPKQNESKRCKKMKAQVFPNGYEWKTMRKCLKKWPHSGTLALRLLDTCTAHVKHLYGT